jgi:hypothetical protein
MKAPSHDDIARDLIERWIAQFADLFGPGVRAAALLTISRVAGEMSEREEAKMPDLWPD